MDGSVGSVQSVEERAGLRVFNQSWTVKKKKKKEARLVTKSLDLVFILITLAVKGETLILKVE